MCDEVNVLLKLKRQLWLKNNDISINFNKIKNILAYYGLDNIKEVIGAYGQSNLLIIHNNKTFKIEINEEYMQLRIGERNMAINPKGKEKYHRIIVNNKQLVFDGDNCWTNLAIWITEK